VAYDEALAGRIRDVVALHEVAEKKMFGGLAFMLGGNMACGIIRDELMVRVGSDDHDRALAEPHTRAMDFNGRLMRGMLYVEKPGFAGDADLRRWVEWGVRFAGSLPRK
jgi:TfoX/Sxy family transcriptional regulator of competence genes